MQRRLLVEAHRQVPIAVRLARVSQKVAGAVHRLHAHRLAFRFDEEHVLPVMLPVAGPLPQRLVVDERRLHLDIPRGEQDVAHVVRERVVERRALVEPERGARRPLMEREQTQLATELAVIPLLRFLDLREMGLEILLREKRRSVDALHRLVARIALPIGVRGVQYLEGLQFAGRRHVRPDAEIDEGLRILDRVTRDFRLAGGLLVD